MWPEFLVASEADALQAPRKRLRKGGSSQSQPFSAPAARASAASPNSSEVDFPHRPKRTARAAPVRLEAAKPASQFVPAYGRYNQDSRSDRASARTAADVADFIVADDEVDSSQSDAESASASEASSSSVDAPNSDVEQQLVQSRYRNTAAPDNLVEEDESFIASDEEDDDGKEKQRGKGKTAAETKSGTEVHLAQADALPLRREVL
jgi:hypothetical protein